MAVKGDIDEGNTCLVNFIILCLYVTHTVILKLVTLNMLHKIPHFAQHKVWNSESFKILNTLDDLVALPEAMKTIKTTDSALAPNNLLIIVI